MPFRARNDRVFIAPEKGPEKIGSIFIPETAKDRLRKERGLVGVVRYAGPGTLLKNGKRWPMPVKAGDRVIYLDQPWPTTTIAGEELVVMRDDGVIAVIDEGER